MKKTLLALYTEILASFNVFPNEQGLLTLRIDEEDSNPVTLPDGKRLALPTDYVLNLPPGEPIIAYHPLSEMLNLGVSRVHNLQVQMARIRLTYVLSQVLVELVELCADSARHAKMSPKAQAVLQIMPAADKTTVEAVRKIIRAVGSENKRSLISMYPKRQGRYQGHISRLCNVTFPFLEEFEDLERREVFGVKLRKKDFEALKDLFLYILPDADDRETYTAPSLSQVAPYYDSFLHAYLKVAKQINRITTIHKKELRNYKEYVIPVDWEDKLDDLFRLDAVIPPLEGNKGEGDDKTTVASNTQIPHESAKPKLSLTAGGLPIAQTDSPPWAEPAAVPALPTQAPAPAQAPVDDDEPRALTMREIDEKRKRNAGFAMQAPQQPQQMTAPPGYMQAPGMPAGHLVPIPAGMPMMGQMAPGMSMGAMPMMGQPMMQQHQIPGVPAHRQPMMQAMPMMHGGMPMAPGMTGAPVWLGNQGGAVMGQPMMSAPGMPMMPLVR